MRILTISYEYPPIGGGGSAVVSALAEQLVCMDNQVEVITSRMPGLKPVERRGGVRIHRARCIRRYRHYTTSPELLTTMPSAYMTACGSVRRRYPDVVHAHFVVPSGLVAWMLWKRFGIPYVITAHGSDIPGYNPDRFTLTHSLLRPLWKLILRDASQVTSPSRFLADLVRNEIDIPLHIVPNGYSAAATRRGKKRNLALVVSRLFPRKGVQHFIEAVRDLRTDWEFVIAGDGPYRGELEAMARQSATPIRFTGFLDKPRLQALYDQARILVFPSIRENFPMVLLEGMDAGCAVISTNAAGCAEVVGDAGMVVPPADALAIRRSLVDLMASPERCRSLGQQAKHRATQFRWPRIAGLYMDVFREAGQGGRSTAMAQVKQDG